MMKITFLLSLIFLEVRAESSLEALSKKINDAGIITVQLTGQSPMNMRFSDCKVEEISSDREAKINRILKSETHQTITQAVTCQVGYSMNGQAVVSSANLIGNANSFQIVSRHVENMSGAQVVFAMTRDQNGYKGTGSLKGYYYHNHFGHTEKQKVSNTIQL